MTSNLNFAEISFAAQRIRTQYSVKADVLQDMQNELMKAELSVNSQKALAASLKVFGRYCEAFGGVAFPAVPQTMKDFITWSIRVREYRLETIANVLWAVRYQHARAQVRSPLDESVKTFWANCRRAVKEPHRHKRALTVEHLRRLLNSLQSNHPIDLRDRAILSLGFASALRRSELSALTLDDVASTRKGLVLTIRSSKTDQRAKGALIAVPFGSDREVCPVRALRRWIKVRGSWAGPLFVRFTGQRESTRQVLSAPSIAGVLKRGLERIGIESHEYGAHSLRAGMATAAAEAGASVIAIQMRTRHRRVESVMRYVRPAQVFQIDPLAGVL